MGKYENNLKVIFYNKNGKCKLLGIIKDVAIQKFKDFEDNEIDKINEITTLNSYTFEITKDITNIKNIPSMFI